MKEKVPFQVLFFEISTVITDEWTASLEDLKVSDIAEKKSK